MKNIKRLFVLALALVLIPTGVFAKGKDTTKYYKDYNYTNLTQTLDAEEIEYSLDDYKETSDQVTIYMFRGQGCSHCREFLEFIKGAAEEYGKYFKLVAFETWQDTNNSTLMQDVATYLGQEASGVPFIIIGEQTYSGYAEEYNESMLETIMNEYDKKPEDRYDVLEKMNNKPNHDLVVGIGAVILIGGIVAATIVTRRNNK